MKKRLVWACTEGCPITRRPCAHLERLLPPMRHKKLAYIDTSNMSLDVFQVYRPTFELSVFTENMRGYGFIEEWDLDLLTAKYFYGLSSRKIATEFNWCSSSTISRRLKTLHKLLVERGFKPKKRKS